MTYRHGVYADLQDTDNFLSPQGASTLPVYFGIAPVHQLADYSDKVNKPILMDVFSAESVGYNDSNWAEFDLCEAIYAHFKNGIQPVGPIVLINVLDPDTMKTADQTANVTLTNGQGYISNDKVILKSIEIAGKVLGTDYSASYTADGSKVLIKDLKGTLVSPLAVTFDVVTPSSVTKTEIIGGTDANGVRTGINVVELVYQTFNKVPTIFDSPGWSHIKDVNDALKLASQKINGHWYAWVNSNIDTTDATGAITIAEATAWKATNNYTGAGEGPCWPMTKIGTRKFHLSTLTTVAMQQTDFNNDDVPMESPSNKKIEITGLCLADGTNIVFDQSQANTLNASGIRTACFWGGRWVLWGPHTGAFVDGTDIDIRDKFDSSVRMAYHLMNDFQIKYSSLTDKLMTRAMVETILNDYQEYMDSLIARGALLLGSISFNESSNPTSDMVEGDFIFDVMHTSTPPGKSLTAKVKYTTNGLDTLFGGEEA